MRNLFVAVCCAILCGCATTPPPPDYGARIHQLSQDYTALKSRVVDLEREAASSKEKLSEAENNRHIAEVNHQKALAEFDQHLIDLREKIVKLKGDSAINFLQLRDSIALKDDVMMQHEEKIEDHDKFITKERVKQAKFAKKDQARDFFEDVHGRKAK